LRIALKLRLVALWVGVGRIARVLWSSLGSVMVFSRVKVCFGAGVEMIEVDRLRGCAATLAAPALLAAKRR
jgi:hypothetical protein